MILRRWAAVAACILAFVGPAAAQGSRDTQHSQSQQQDGNPEQSKSLPSQPSVSIPPSQPQRAGQGPAKTEVYEPNCNKPKDHDEADFCVQRRVAKAAEDSYQLTGLQTAIGALGLFFVIVTLGVTAWTGKAASMAAQAAIDAVGAERAWVTVSNFSIAPATNIIIDDIHYPLGYVVHVEWVIGPHAVVQVLS